jgi:hypothetical protein
MAGGDDAGDYDTDAQAPSEAAMAATNATVTVMV